MLNKPPVSIRNWLHRQLKCPQLACSQRGHRKRVILKQLLALHGCAGKSLTSSSSTPRGMISLNTFFISPVIFPVRSMAASFRLLQILHTASLGCLAGGGGGQGARKGVWPLQSFQIMGARIHVAKLSFAVSGW